MLWQQLNVSWNRFSFALNPQRFLQFLLNLQNKITPLKSKICRETNSFLSYKKTSAARHSSAWKRDDAETSRRHKHASQCRGLLQDVLIHVCFWRFSVKAVKICEWIQLLLCQFISVSREKVEKSCWQDFQELWIKVYRDTEEEENPELKKQVERSARRFYLFI